MTSPTKLSVPVARKAIERKDGCSRSAFDPESIL